MNQTTNQHETARRAKKNDGSRVVKNIPLRSNSFHAEQWFCAACLDNYKSPL
jgi:hypothetical protein